MRTIGITGSKGFIGRHLVTYLRNYEEYKVEEYNSDILFENDVKDFVKKCDTVVHLAGINRCSNDIHLLNTNVLGTYHFARECLIYDKKIIVAGSDYQFGVYGSSKKICEAFVASMSSINLRGLYVRIPKVFGPSCKPRYNSFVTTILYNIANKIEYKSLVKSPFEVLRLIYIDDLCESFRNFINTDTHVLTEQGRLDSPIINLWKRDGEFSIMMSDFCKIAEGEQVPGYPISAYKKIQSTLRWYEDNGKTSG